MCIHTKSYQKPSFIPSTSSAPIVPAMAFAPKPRTLKQVLAEEVTAPELKALGVVVVLGTAYATSPMLGHMVARRLTPWIDQNEALVDEVVTALIGAIKLAGIEVTDLLA
jgi:hypothetical protein